MSFSTRHVALLLGIALATFSFLFFGRRESVYSFLLLSGILITAVSLFIILIKDTTKEKLLWIGVLAVSITIQRLAEPWFIKQSFKILIDRNKILFAEVNNIFMSKPGEVFYLVNSANNAKQFSNEELRGINELLHQTEVYMIAKNNYRIYYGTYGMLDVRVGISYFYSDSIPGERFKWIEDRWYH